jgi:hypothetical protein
MKHDRWFNFGIAAVLLALAVVTVWQLAAANQVVAANTSQTAVAQSEKLQDPLQCPFTPEQIRSIHPEVIDDMGHTIPFTKDGPTGVEGGIYMLRYCVTR